MAVKKQPIAFGNYYLLDRINIGGMAEIWRAKATAGAAADRIVAIKRILPNIAEDDEFITMFIDEARIAVQLTHQNICQVFDLGKIGDSFYIAMEYVAGKDLRAVFDRCRRRGEPAPVPMTCYMVAQMCEGLDFAHRSLDGEGHELNVVHRDVSPQNCLVSFEGDVKLIDFGIAKAAIKATKTQAGILKGKFGYMSPEYVRGEPLDRRSDVFSAGVVLYELLTNERLFTGESDFSVLERVRQVDVLPPSRYNRRVPEALERLVLKALARNPEDRYPWASDLADALRQFSSTGDAVYSRRELSQYVRSAFAEDLEREKVRQGEYAELTLGPPPEQRAMPAASQPAGHGVRPSLPRPSTQQAIVRPTVRIRPSNESAAAFPLFDEHAQTDGTDPGISAFSPEADLSAPKSSGAAPQERPVTPPVRAPDATPLSIPAVQIPLSPEPPTVNSRPPGSFAALGYLPTSRPTTPSPTSSPPPPAAPVPAASPAQGPLPSPSNAGHLSRSHGAPRDPIRQIHKPLPRSWVAPAALAACMVATGGAAAWWWLGGWGTLALSYEPADAALFVDGVEICSTSPCSARKVRAGSRRLEIKKDGFSSFNETIRIPRGDVARLAADPIRLKAIVVTAQLIVASDPSDSEIAVDGTVVKRAGRPGVYVGEIEVGKSHEIVVSKPGFGPWKKTFVPGFADKSVQEIAQLTPQRLSVRITSSPPGAKVLVDGEEVGTAPLLLTTLDPSRAHAFVLQKPCHQDADESIPAGGGSVQISKTLMRIANCTP